MRRGKVEMREREALTVRMDTCTDARYNSASCWHCCHLHVGLKLGENNTNSNSSQAHYTLWVPCFLFPFQRFTLMIFYFWPYLQSVNTNAQMRFSPRWTCQHKADVTHSSDPIPECTASFAPPPFRLSWRQLREVMRAGRSVGQVWWMARHHIWGLSLFHAWPHKKYLSRLMWRLKSLHGLREFLLGLVLGYYVFYDVMGCSQIYA